MSIARNEEGKKGRKEARKKVGKERKKEIKKERKKERKLEQQCKNTAKPVHKAYELDQQTSTHIEPLASVAACFMNCAFCMSIAIMAPLSRDFAICSLYPK